MAYLKNAAIVRDCKGSEVKNRHAVYTTGLFGTRPHWGALARYVPDHRGRVPTTLCTWSPDVPNGADCPRASLFCLSNINVLWERCNKPVLDKRTNTGLFISPSGISERDCATTKTDTAARSISIGRESLQVFFCPRGLGVLPGSTARG